jgi:hypothetical protein
MQRRAGYRTQDGEVQPDGVGVEIFERGWHVNGWWVCIAQ